MQSRCTTATRRRRTVDVVGEVILVVVVMVVVMMMVVLCRENSRTAMVHTSRQEERDQQGERDEGCGSVLLTKRNTE